MVKDIRCSSRTYKVYKIYECIINNSGRGHVEQQGPVYALSIGMVGDTKYVEQQGLVLGDTRCSRTTEHSNKRYKI